MAEVRAWAWTARAGKVRAVARSEVASEVTERVVAVWAWAMLVEAARVASATAELMAEQMAEGLTASKVAESMAERAAPVGERLV